MFWKKAVNVCIKLWAAVTDSFLRPFYVQNVKTRRIAKENHPPPQITDDQQTLALHVEALQAQLEEQTKLAKDQASWRNCVFQLQLACCEFKTEDWIAIEHFVCAMFLNNGGVPLAIIC